MRIRFLKQNIKKKYIVEKSLDCDMEIWKFSPSVR